MPVDRTAWKRKEYFEQYHLTVPCTYSMTVQIDITDLKMNGVSLYPSLLYGLSKAVNTFEEFRMAFDSNGQLGIYDLLHPCYTVFHNESETFSTIWTEYADDYEVFMKSYELDRELYGNREGLEGKPHTPQNCFNVSMIPWASFEGFNLNLAKGNDYFFPIFTLGRYHEYNRHYFLPLAIQVHHAVCDGFHVCRLIDKIRAILRETFCIR